jgi:holin-like protein
MLHAIGALLAFQLAGEAITQLFGLPVPGPVVGMALLFAAMAALPVLAQRLRDTAAGLLQHLSLLFVPAGVGVMLHAQRVADEWAAIAAALVAGTAITLVVTALTIKVCVRLLGTRGTGDGEA